MAGHRKRFDQAGENQLNIFDILRAAEEEQHQEKPAGSLNLDTQFRAVLSEALKASPLSRYQVAARMSELTGAEITFSMLNSWTAESKDNHRFPAIFLPAFCEATGSYEPLKLLAEPVGLFTLPGPEALRAEIQRAMEKEKFWRSKRRQQELFLKQIETRR